MTNNRKLTVASTAIALLSAAGAARANLIVNGDFQTGALGPATTTYSYDTTMYPESTWNIVSYDTIHPSWVDYYDHTKGNADGYYMVVNGSTSSQGYAYRQIVEGVTPNTDYELTGWFSSLYPASVASVDFRVFDLASETYIATYSFVAPSDLATWEQRGFTFNSGSSGDRLAVEIWDTNLQASGNDYAIDDLSLSATVVPEPASMALLVPAGLVLSRRARRR